MRHIKDTKDFKELILYYNDTCLTLANEAAWQSTLKNHALYKKKIFEVREIWDQFNAF